MTWKRSALKNAYEDGREDTYNGNGVESNWKLERPYWTYEDYWIYIRLVGHETVRFYEAAHCEDMIIMDKLSGSDKWV